MTAHLTNEQITQLLTPLPESRVRHNRGQAYVEAWDVRRWLIRIFGFGGWSFEVVESQLVRELEHKNGDKSRWTAVYRVTGRLIIRDTAGREVMRFEDGAAASSDNQPNIGDAHDNALKGAMSGALKRCAVNLGDQFGLSLYNNGGIDPVVIRTIVQRTAGAEPVGLPTDPPVQGEQATEPAEPAESDGAEPDQAGPQAEPALTAPAEEPPAAGPEDPPAQRIANLAAQQPDEWRRYWKAGGHARVMEHEITAPDTKEREQLGVYLTRLGKSVTDKTTAERAAVLAAGQRHGLDETALAREFATSYGHPMAEATPAELRQFAGLMNGAAA